MPAVNLEVLYAIHVEVARAKRLQSYMELTAEYQRREHVCVNRRSWGPHLKALNEVLAEAGKPPLSALTTYSPGGGAWGPPGNEFWGCAPNVPAHPGTALEADLAWVRLTQECHQEQWPNTLDELKPR